MRLIHTSSGRRQLVVASKQPPQCTSTPSRPSQSGPCAVPRLPAHQATKRVASASVLEASPVVPASNAVVTQAPKTADQQHGKAGRHAQPAHGQRVRIAVDVDEVLGRFVYALNQYRRDHHDLEFDVADYHIYDFATVWQCSPDESSHIVHEFFKSRHFLEGIPVIPGAQTSLQTLSSAYDLVVVTSRQHVIRQPTLQWLDTYFPGTFVDVHFGNHYALSGPSMSKSEICKQVGAQVLIDDNPRYALECAQAGIQVLLFDWDGSYAWSKTSCGPTHPLITRVHSWAQVEQALALVAAEYQP